MRYLRHALLGPVVVGAAIVGSPAPASAATTSPVPVSIGSDTVVAGASTTLPLEATGVTQNLGNVTVDVTYDPLIVSITGCTGDPGGAFDLASCNASFLPDTVRFVGVSSGGVTGDLVLANLTFQAIGSPAEVSPLDVTIQTFRDTNGIDMLATDQDGSIEIIAGTPTPCPDSDGDTICDSGDPCPSGPNPPWAVPTGDGDCDGFTDAEEALLFTDTADPCPDNQNHDAWPADLVGATGFGSHDKTINILDIVQLTPPVFGTSPPNPNYHPRKDFDSDNAIGILDIVRLTPPAFGVTCT